jgi:hypothetical protein
MLMMWSFELVEVLVKVGPLNTKTTQQKCRQTSETESDTNRGNSENSVFRPTAPACFIANRGVLSDGGNGVSRK